MVMNVLMNCGRCGVTNTWVRYEGDNPNVVCGCWIFSDLDCALPLRIAWIWTKDGHK